MTEDKLSKEYFDWVVHLVCDNKYTKKLSYQKLLHHLHEIEFTYIIGMDGNRAEDGVNLRYRFGYDRGYDDALIASYLDIMPCSVLEMMVALAMRCEENIMDNPEVGDRTGQWFWNMIVNLKLGSMTDDRFHIDYVDDVVARFLNREYGRNGEGGLFTLEHCSRDLRSIEIWYQMCWYLNEML